MKFYVVSNELKMVIGAPHIMSQEDAACEAVLLTSGKGLCLAPLIVVSERGFDYFTHEIEEDRILVTHEILKKAGLIGG
jgi:hypothetical protein